MATCRTAAIAAGADPVDRREQVCWKRKVGPSSGVHVVRGGVMGLSLGPGVSEFPGFHVRHWFQCGVMVTHEVRDCVMVCVMVF